MRQIFYTTTRMGVYKTVFNEVQRRNKEKGISTAGFTQVRPPSSRRRAAPSLRASSAH